MLLCAALLLLLHSSRADMMNQCRLVGDCSSRMIAVKSSDSMHQCREIGREMKRRYSHETADYISWNSQTNLCIVYETCSDIVYDTVDTAFTVSSYIGCMCQQPVFCQGRTVGNSVVEDEASCDQECLENEACKWFTYFLDIKACILMEDCSTPPAPCSSCLSSQKVCQLSLSPPPLHLVNTTTNI